MPKLRVHNFTVSVDGFAAGPNQTLETPMGTGAERLHQWFFNTAYGQKMFGQPVTATPGIGDQFLAAGDENIGAHIMGRHMFTHSRGEWPDDGWKGWWGDNPPYHHSVFVLTNFPHEPIEMDGGTVFYFCTDGIYEALERAFAAANGQDVRVGGGAMTVQQYLTAGLVDEMHLAISPVLLGRGERVFGDVDAATLGYEVVEMVGTPDATHVRLAKKK